VLKALQAFQAEIKTTNQNKSLTRHDELMSLLFYEIRKDLGIRPQDTDRSMQYGLWASGMPPSAA
jgi:hypothetical protein